MFLPTACPTKVKRKPLLLQNSPVPLFYTVSQQPEATNSPGGKKKESANLPGLTDQGDTLPESPQYLQGHMTVF